MSNIYGIDTNDAAESISCSALGSPKAVNAIDNSALSKGNFKDEGEAIEKDMGGGSDSRAVSKGDCPR